MLAKLATQLYMRLASLAYAGSWRAKLAMRIVYLAKQLQSWVGTMDCFASDAGASQAIALASLLAKQGFAPAG